MLDLSVPGTAMVAQRFPTLEFNRGREAALRVPDAQSARLFRLTSIRTHASGLSYFPLGAVSFGVRRSGAAIFEPVSIRA